jgi:glucose/arabinose dehydrogenase
MSVRLASLVRSTALSAGLLLLPQFATSAQDSVFHAADHDYRIVPVVDGLVNPWSMAFLPNGDMLVTERAGRLRIVRGGQLLAAPVPGLPPIRVGNQGGLLDVVLHPRFAQNRLVYLSYSKLAPDSTRGTTAVIRGRFENDRLTNVEEILVAEVWSQGQGHYGSRLAFDRDGYLFVTVGDRQVPPTGDLEAHPSQGLATHHGKVLRIHDDGRVPQDNPFVGREGALPQIWSYGHRNPQGLFVHPVTNEVWATEHGPQGGDEFNLIQGGRNYGWPVIGFGVNYRSGLNIHSGTTRQGMEQPVKVWVPSIATSGLLYYTGDKFPGWKGSVFAGGMVGQVLSRLTLDEHRVLNEELLVQRRGRIRDVRQGTDGFIYLAIDDRTGAPSGIVRLEPVAR